MDRRRQGQAPFGFRWQGGQLRHEPEEVLIVQEIFRAMVELGKASAVTKALKDSGHATRRGGNWSDVQVGRILKCPAAIGQYEVGKGGDGMVETVQCDPVVSRDVWDRVQEIFTGRRGEIPGEPIFQGVAQPGLVWCGCGRRMDRVTDASKFRCPGCRQSVAEEVLVAVFEEDFWGVLEDHPLLIAAIDERAGVREAAVKLAAVERELAEVERERTTSERLFSDRAISLKRMEALIHPLMVKASSLDKNSLELRNLLAKKVRNFSKKTDWSQLWKDYSSERQWSLINTLLKQIVVDVEEIQLTYRIAEFPLLTSPKGRSEKQQIRASTNQPSGDESLYIRLPKPGTFCSITGLGRAKLNELILPNPRNNHRPPIESISLKAPGQSKGVRLIVRASLLDYCRKIGFNSGKVSELSVCDDQEKL